MAPDQMVRGTGRLRDGPKHDQVWGLKSRVTFMTVKMINYGLTWTDTAGVRRASAVFPLKLFCSAGGLGECF